MINVQIVRVTMPPSFFFFSASAVAEAGAGGAGFGFGATSTGTAACPLTGFSAAGAGRAGGAGASTSGSGSAGDSGSGVSTSTSGSIVAVVGACPFVYGTAAGVTSGADLSTEADGGSGAEGSSAGAEGSGEALALGPALEPEFARSSFFARRAALAALRCAVLVGLTGSALCDIFKSKESIRSGATRRTERITWFRAQARARPRTRGRRCRRRRPTSQMPCAMRNGSWWAREWWVCRARRVNASPSAYSTFNHEYTCLRCPTRPYVARKQIQMGARWSRRKMYGIYSCATDTGKTDDV